MDKLTTIMASVFRVEQSVVKENASMSDIPAWDSLNHMNLILEIENQYSIQLSGDEIAEMQSVATIRKIINRHVHQ